jgi:HK97 family phage major capsid protein
MEIKELSTLFADATAEFKSAQDKHDAEIKAAGVVSTELKAALTLAETKLTDQFAALDAKLIAMEVGQKRKFDLSPKSRKSLGAQFVEHALYNEEIKNGYGFGKSVELKDISNLASSAGGLVSEFRDPEVYRTVGGMRQLRVRDLIPTVPASGNAVVVMRQTTATNEAKPQGTTAGVGAGEFAAKSQSSYVWTEVTVPIRTIAHFVPASRQILSDAPQVQSLIDTELSYGLQLESDDQILNGDGTGQNLTGILGDSAINDVGQLASGTTDAQRPAAMIEHIRAAVTECQKFEYYNINGLLLNPVDFQTLETAKATDGHYLLVAFAATSGETPQIWRVPVIVSNAIAVGNFLIGDWTLGAKIYQREGVSIRVSESDGTDFIKNAVKVLAEERMCLAVNRPKAYCKGLFTIAA